MILNKVAVPVGVDPKSYWEAMLLGITNDKYCLLDSFSEKLPNHGNRDSHVNTFPLL